MNLFPRDPEIASAFRMPIPGAGAGNRPPYSWGTSSKHIKRMGLANKNRKLGLDLIEKMKRMGF